MTRFPVCYCCLPTCPICCPDLNFSAGELAEVEADLAAIRPEECEPLSEDEIGRMVEGAVDHLRKWEKETKRIRESN